MDIFFGFCLFIGTAVFLWGLSRLSPSWLFRRCNTVLLIIFVLSLVAFCVPIISGCDGSVLYGYRDCDFISEWLAGKVGVGSFVIFFLTIAVYAVLLGISAGIFACRFIRRKYWS